ncbi:hypothetical protein [Parabacteroides goldsteinii]|uniref:hypothetical protein n=1 Tax=Parabacteroides goldsteinii TaxID=328812 RepID=UPI0021655371|nr:hypothetical protein [Parabacteroides goldsteinii]MCS2429319.1 hypothetical protein [Parabacteroides goldsteinii]
MIVCHEKAHIECRHWIDLLLMQAAIIVIWYCPAVWLLRNELHTLHEYEADSRVLASGIQREDYQMFLIKRQLEQGSQLFPTVSITVHLKNV